MTETIEQITERAKCDAESIVDDLPESLTAQGQMWNDGFETGYVQGVIAEATRDRWISVEDRLPKEEKNELSSMVLCQTRKEGMAVLCYSYRYNSWQAWNGDEWPDATHWMPLPSIPTSPTT